MSRSGYSDDGDCDNNYHYLYRAVVKRAVQGPRGQRLLRETLAVLDAIPVKELAANAAFNEAGQFCTLGAVEYQRGGDVDALRVEMEHAEENYDWSALVKRFNVPETLIREMMYVNDEYNYVGNVYTYQRDMTPAKRWEIVRTWVAAQIAVAEGAANAT